MIKVDSPNKIGTLRDVKTGELSEIKFTRLCSMVPGRPDPLLKKWGLAAENGFLDVDIETL